MAKRKTQSSTKLFPSAAEEEDKDKVKKAEGENEDEDQPAGENTDEEEPAAEGEDDENQPAEGEDTDEEEPAAEDDEEETPESAKAERKRISAILQSKHAKGRGKLAKHLAFNTAMSAKDAVAALEASPQASADGGFQNAMGRVKNPSVGPGAAAESQNSVLKTLSMRSPSRVIKPRSNSTE